MSTLLAMPPPSLPPLLLPQTPPELRVHLHYLVDHLDARLLASVAAFLTYTLYPQAALLSPPDAAC